MIAFLFGLVIGLSLGVVFYRWWIHQDLKDLNRAVHVLKEENKRLARFASRNN